jgi:hypothetical protein
VNAQTDAVRREANRRAHEHDYTMGIARLANLTDHQRTWLAADRYIETLPQDARDVIVYIAEQGGITAAKWLTRLVAHAIAEEWGCSDILKTEPTGKR